MKKDYSWLIVILLVAFLLRLIALDQSLWLDEAIEWWGVTAFDLKRLLTGYMLGDFNPPGHHILMWFWVRIFGDSEITLRMPSVLFGVGTVGIIYKISEFIFQNSDVELKRQKTNSQDHFLRTVPGVLQGPSFPALLAATNGLLIYYSQEARMYAMATFFVTANVWVFLKLKKEFSLKLFIVYCLLFIVALYSHYLAWLMIPVFVLEGMREMGGVRKVRGMKGMKYAIPLLATIPLWLLLLKQLQNGIASAGNSQWAMLSQTTPKNIALVFVKFLTGRVPFPEQWELQVLVVMLVTLFWLGVVRGVKEMWKVREQRIIVYWFVVPLVLGGLIGLVVPVFSYFRFLFVLPAAILLFSRGIVVRGTWATKAIGGMGVIGYLSFSLFYLLFPANHREDWRRTVAEIHAQSKNPVVLIHPAVRPPFDYYDRERSVVISSNWDSLFSEDLGFPILWYVPYGQQIFEPRDELRKEMVKTGSIRTFERHFNGVTVERWSNPR